MIKKIIASFLSVTLLAAIPGQSHSAYAAPLSAALNAALVRSWVPESLGKIEEVIPRGPKTIFFIQDAHDSLEAQKNIVSLITHLTSKAGVKSVFEEGFEGPVPTDDYFGFIKDARLKRKVSYFFLDKLRIGAAEFAHINRKADFRLIGIDHAKLHAENLRAYRQAARVQKSIDLDLRRMQDGIEKLSQIHLPRDIKQRLDLRARFDRGELDLSGYLARLGAFEPIDAARFPALNLILSAGRGDHPEDAAGLRQIESKTLFEELNRLDAEFILKRLDADGKKIYEYARAISLLKRLNAIKLSQEEYDAVKTSLAGIKTADLAALIAAQSHQSVVLSNRWETKIKYAERFYDLAAQRSLEAGKQLEPFISGEEQTAALVFGGFHQKALIEFLKHKNISVVLISPRITRPDKIHSLYYKQLMSKGSYDFESSLAAVAAKPLPVLSLPYGRPEIRAIYNLARRYPDEPVSLLDRHLSRSELRSVSSAKASQDSAAIFSKSVIISGETLHAVALTPEIMSIYAERIHMLVTKYAGNTNFDIEADIRQMGRLKTDPDLSIAVFNQADEIVGFLIAYPLKEEQLQKKMPGAAYTQKSFYLSKWRVENKYHKSALPLFILHTVLSRAQDQGYETGYWRISKLESSLHPLKLYDRWVKKGKAEALGTFAPDEVADIPGVEHLGYKLSIEKLMPDFTLFLESLLERERSEVRSEGLPIERSELRGRYGAKFYAGASILSAIAVAALDQATKRYFAYTIPESPELPWLTDRFAFVNVKHPTPFGHAFYGGMQAVLFFAVSLSVMLFTNWLFRNTMQRLPKPARWIFRAPVLFTALVIGTAFGGAISNMAEAMIAGQVMDWLYYLTLKSRGAMNLADFFIDGLPLVIPLAAADLAIGYVLLHFQSEHYYWDEDEPIEQNRSELRSASKNIVRFSREDLLRKVSSLELFTAGDVEVIKERAKILEEIYPKLSDEAKRILLFPSFLAMFMGMKPGYLAYTEKGEPLPGVLADEISQMPEVMNQLGLLFSSHITLSYMDIYNAILNAEELLIEHGLLNTSNIGLLDAIPEAYHAQQFDDMLGLILHLFTSIERAAKTSVTRERIWNGILLGYPISNILALDNAWKNDSLNSLYIYNTDFKDIGLITTGKKNDADDTNLYLARIVETLYYSYSLLRSNKDFSKFAAELHLPADVLSAVNFTPLDSLVRSELRSNYSDAEFKKLWDEKFAEPDTFGFDEEMRRRWDVPDRDFAEFSAGLSPYTKRLRLSPWVQFWIRSLAIDQDPGAFNFTKVPDSERLFKGLDLGDGKWDVLINKGPRRKYDALLVPQKYSRQILSFEDVAAFIKYLKMTEAFVFYNSLWGGASVNSKHFQISFSIPPYFSKLEKDENVTAKKYGEVFFGTPKSKDYGSNVLVFSSRDTQELAKSLWLAIQDLHSKNISYNLTGRGEKIVLVPRKEEYPPSYSGGSLGAKESLREFSIVSEETFNKPEEELGGLLRRSIQEALLDDERFARMVERLETALSHSLDEQGKLNISKRDTRITLPLREALRLGEVDPLDIEQIVREVRLLHKRSYFADRESEDAAYRIPEDIEWAEISLNADGTLWIDQAGQIHILSKTFIGGRERSEAIQYSEKVFMPSGEFRYWSFDRPSVLFDAHFDEFFVYTAEDLNSGDYNGGFVGSVKDIESLHPEWLRPIIREHFRRQGVMESPKTGLDDTSVVTHPVSVFRGRDAVEIHQETLDILNTWRKANRSLIKQRPALGIALTALTRGLKKNIKAISPQPLRSELRTIEAGALEDLKRENPDFFTAALIDNGHAFHPELVVFPDDARGDLAHYFHMSSLADALVFKNLLLTRKVTIQSLIQTLLNNGFLAGVDDPEKTFMNVKEALKNAVVWGNENKTGSIVVLRRRIEGNSLVVDIIDQGTKPIDSSARPEAPRSAGDEFYGGRFGFSRHVQPYLDRDYYKNAVYDFPILDSKGERIGQILRLRLPLSISAALEFASKSSLKKFRSELRIHEPASTRSSYEKVSNLYPVNHRLDGDFNSALKDLHPSHPHDDRHAARNSLKLLAEKNAGLSDSPDLAAQQAQLLLRLLGDPDTTIRKTASRAIGRIHNFPVENLIAFLHHPEIDPYYRTMTFFDPLNGKMTNYDPAAGRLFARLAAVFAIKTGLEKQPLRFEGILPAQLPDLYKGNQAVETFPDPIAFLSSENEVAADDAIRAAAQIPGFKYAADAAKEILKQLPEMPAPETSGRSELRYQAKVQVPVSAQGKNIAKSVSSRGVLLLNEAELSSFTPSQMDELYEMISLNHTQLRLVIYGERLQSAETPQLRALVKLKNVFLVRGNAGDALKKYGARGFLNIHLTRNPTREWGPLLKPVLLKDQPGVIAAVVDWLRKGSKPEGIQEKNGVFTVLNDFAAHLQQELLSHLVVAYSA